jgi:ribose-phosphate pyrophosphokinase
MIDNIKIFSGNGNPFLTKAIASNLNIPLSACSTTTFADGEIFVEIQENVRGRDVFVVQVLCPPINNNIMELLITLDALKRASAKSITAVLPYYAYARQDRKVAPRTPISSKLLADLIEKAGATRVVSVDLHAGQIQGFFDVPFDHLFALPVLYKYIKNNYDIDKLTLIAPDAGSVERTRAYGKRLGCPMAIIDKRREGKNRAQALNLIGEVEGRDALILDDIIDTAGTLTEAYGLLESRNANSVSAFGTHGLFSGPAIERIKHTKFKEIVVTDTIPLRPELQKLEASGVIKVLSIAPLLGEAIRRISTHDSVSSLFI